MHELSITNTLIKDILASCNDAEKKIKKVEMELGALTGFKKDPIQFYFDMQKKEYKTINNTILDIVVVQGMVECMDCRKQTIIVDPILMFCAKCNSGNVKIIAGKDIVLKNIIL